MYSTIKNHINKIKSNRLYYNISIIAGGTFVAQGIALLLSPIITRLYSPAEYGLFTSFSALVSLIAIGASLDYHKAIPILKDEKQVSSLISLSTWILVIFTLFFTMLTLLFGNSLLIMLNNESLIEYKLIIPLGIFILGCNAILSQVLLKNKNFKLISFTQILTVTFTNSINIILGYLAFGHIGLLIGFFFGRVIGVTIMLIKNLKYIKITDFCRLSEMKYLLKRYKKFAAYTAPSNYVYTASNQLPLIFLTGIFGTAIAGLFGIANSVVKLPLTLISQSVAKVFYAEAASIGKNNPLKIKQDAISLMKKLALLAVVPALALFLFGPVLFSIVFGSNWEEAGTYASLLSISLFFHFIITPFGRLLEIFEKQKIGLLFNILRLLLVFFIFGSVIILKSTPIVAVGIYSIGMGIAYILLFFMILKVLNIEITKANEKV